MTRNILMYVLSAVIILSIIGFYNLRPKAVSYDEFSNKKINFNDYQVKEFSDINYIQNLNTLNRHVFFDLGANNGDSIKYFMSPNRDSSSGNKIRGYGARNNIKWEIYAFEANPLFENDLNKIKVKYEQEGHKFNLYSKSAASIVDEKVTFFLDTINIKKNFWGSSLDSNHPDVRSSNKTKVIVDGYDVSNLIRKYSVDDEIIVKIDIEGTEFKLLKHFLTHDTYKYIDVIAVEFHPYLEPQKNLINFLKESFNIFNITYVQWF